MGQAVSSSGEEGVLAADAATGDEALAARSRASAAGDGLKVGEKAAATTEQEAPAAGRSAPAAASVEKGCEEWPGFYGAQGDGAPANSSPAANGDKKRRTVRMTQDQVDHILAYTPSRIPKLPDLTNVSEDLKTMVTESMGRAAELLREFQESHLREQAWVKQQMEEKGYVEYEVDDNGGVEEVVLARRGRRRYRPGVRITAGGSVKRVN